MAAILLLAACFVTLASACDICGDPSHQMSSWQQQGGGNMMNWQGGQQQQQEQQQMMMMMQMMNMMQQQKNWGNDNKPMPSVPGSGPTPNTPSRPAVNGECQGFADVVFLLDSSGSIGDVNYQTQLKFVSDVVGSFGLARNGRDGYQFSVVSFSANAREEFNLKHYRTTAALQRAIMAIPYDSKNTDTHKGLQYVRQNSFLSANGGRYGAVKIVIAITDGRSNQPTETTKEADALRKYGALVLAIGVGNDVDPKELEGIASGPSNVFKVDNFDVLSNIRKEVQKRACEITIEEGGGSGGKNTEFDWQTYLTWCMEQEKMKGEQQIAKDILQSFEEFKMEEKKEDQTKAHEKEEKQKIIYMAERVQKMEKYMMDTEGIGDKLMEMKHHYMYLVTAEVIKFCPMKDMESDVMRLLIHQDTTWSPGRADQCDVEDMAKMDDTDGPKTAEDWARQLANLSQREQVEMFFSGTKDAVCEALKTYVSQVKGWEDQHPQLKRMLGLMY